MDLAGLIIEFGILAVTAGAAAVAWWQANVAKLSAHEAKTYQELALAAETRAATALERQADAADRAIMTELQRRRAAFGKDLRRYAVDVRDHAFDPEKFPLTDQGTRKKMLQGDALEFHDRRAVDLYGQIENLHHDLRGGGRSYGWSVTFLEQLSRDVAEWIYSQETAPLARRRGRQ